ncbi:hypothetical protein ABZ820_12675 [Streptomyces diacarni]|uniref:hypothetical protein n=1 Tax=Streptomyces diacarni TaxID=2800381 RepID=UPI0033C30F1B
MTTYTPSDSVKAAVKAVEDAHAQLDECRRKLRAAVAADLRQQPDVTNSQAAKALPFSEEIVRSIAREFDLPRKRKPTVRSIKPQKRTGGKSSS